VQILDTANAEVAVNKDATTGEFKIATPSGGLPGDGEYRLRVTGAANSRNTAPFTLKVTRLGLVQNVYNARLEKTYLAYFGPRENDQAVIDETLYDLVELVKDDGNKPGAYEMLGIVYLNSRRDPAKAEWAMGQAIKNNGAAVIKITFDSQWRRLAKLKSGKVDWEDPRSGWLRIYSGKMSLTDPASRVLASVDGAQIKELTKVVTNNNHLVTINVEGVRRPFVFLPGNRESLDADLVIKFIQTYVVGKKN